MRETLFLLQKYIIRLIFGKTPREHCMPLFKELGALTIMDMVRWENLKLMFKVMNDLAPKSVSDLFVRREHLYSTRNCGLEIPKHSLVKFNHSFLVKSITEWNALDIQLKLLNSVKLFSKQLKLKLISKY